MTAAHQRRWIVVALSVLLPAGTASAEPSEGSETSPERATLSAAAGMLLPYTIAARVDSQTAFARAMGGYDSARRSAQLEGTAEIRIIGPLAARLGVMSNDSSNKLRPTAGLRVQALSQAQQAIDMSVGAFYKPEGFTQAEGEVEFVLAFGRRFGRLGLFGNLVYGQDPEGAERDGEARLAALYAWSAALQVGIDTRLRIDLGSQAGKRRTAGEAAFDFVAGPTASYALGTVAVLAQAGLSGVDAGTPRWGAVALLGLAGSI
jgi:hypothetical protein